MRLSFLEKNILIIVKDKSYIQVSLHRFPVIIARKFEQNTREIFNALMHDVELGNCWVEFYNDLNYSNFCSEDKS